MSEGLERKTSLFFHHLHTTRSINITREEPEIDVQKVLDELRELKKERGAVEETVSNYLRELGYEV